MTKQTNTYSILVDATSGLTLFTESKWHSHIQSASLSLEFPSMERTLSICRDYIAYSVSIKGKSPV